MIDIGHKNTQISITNLLKKLSKSGRIANLASNYYIMSKKLLTSTLAVIAILVSSCSGNKTIDNTYLITYDDMAGFTSSPNSTLMISTMSHSGNTCTFVDKDLTYGATYKRLISELSSKKINKVTLRVWVRKDVDNANLKLVCSINKGEETILWNAIDTKSQNLVKGEWKEITFDTDISKVNDGGNNLIIYPLNDGEGKIMMDDLLINFE